MNIDYYYSSIVGSYLITRKKEILLYMSEKYIFDNWYGVFSLIILDWYFGEGTCQSNVLVNERSMISFVYL